MHPNKFFSIIIACKNSTKTIRKTLHSLKSQKFKNYEIIAVDSSNNLQTINIIRMYNSNAKIIKIFNASLYEALNVGVRNSRGRYIFFLHTDDSLYSPEVLLKVFNQIGNSDAAYGNIKIINNQLQTIRKWKDNFFFKKSFKFGWHPPHTSLFVKKRLFSSYGLFKTKYHISGDYDLMLRFFFIKKIKLKYLNHYINNMRAGGLSTANWYSSVKSNIECWKIWKSYNFKFSFFTIFLKILLKIFQLNFLRFFLSFKSRE